MHSANADELAERTSGQNREMIHDSMMTRTPVSSGARRFSEGTYRRDRRKPLGRQSAVINL